MRLTARGQRALEEITLPGAPPKALTLTPVVRDATLECDVVIVGSGAGGGAGPACSRPPASTW